MDIFKIIEGKDSDEVEDIILSKLLSKDFYIEVEKLLTASYSYFLPIVQKCLQQLLEEISVDEEVLDYHIVLSKRGFEKIEERELLIDESSVDYSDGLKKLDNELANRIFRIGEVVAKLKEL